MTPSTKDYRMFDLARKEALSSDMNNKHGCVITFNGTPISSGHNYYRGLHHGSVTFGVHAEGSASDSLPLKGRQRVLHKETSQV
jgi:hypothetical protein